MLSALIAAVLALGTPASGSSGPTLISCHGDFYGHITCTETQTPSKLKRHDHGHAFGHLVVTQPLYR